ncbi:MULTISPECIES: DMT family transporter [Enterobacteriaceae]|nr:MULTISPECIES: multidrug efflux SMR transporter [Enterobacteriaceae]MCU2364290.1 multidrug efflux SMR transporter [Enterobacter hormaechei subsp. xiangfangensis]MCA5461773.1 multidrug efflux SMR transporter [Klebsiella pneumoniae]MCU2755030.1 multidrug efflux SMR transporter [Enterobacter hormaechei subsp. xiangfangensis]MCU2998983.1 multidrug efflux SMR transporter [Enterobacter hormaechei subsp. xiangfangensis]MDV5217360.1 multidrug efflux SMR transporter [Klebsiella pneumoniae]
MGSCAAPSAKGDDKFITTDYLQQCRIFCLTFIGVSMYFLSLATRTIPVGTAYAVWVGIGALGTAAYGIIYLNEDKGLLRIACFGLILAGIIGLKILAGHKQL